jgi:predicted metal-binding membrane protein
MLPLQVFPQQTAPKPISQMKKIDFLDMAHDSDSLTALVNMFFRKRKNARTGYIVTGGLTLVTGFIAASTATQQLVNAITLQPVDDKGIEASGIAFFTVLFGGTALSSAGLIKYSKTKLYGIIQQYPESQVIPEKYKAKIQAKDFY